MVDMRGEVNTPRTKQRDLLDDLKTFVRDKQHDRSVPPPSTGRSSKSYASLAASRSEYMKQNYPSSPPVGSTDNGASPVSHRATPTRLHFARDGHIPAYRQPEDGEFEFSSSKCTPLHQRATTTSKHYTPPSLQRQETESGTVARLKVHNERLLEELERMMEARRAVTEALSEVSAQNARLVSAWLEEKKEKEELRSSLTNKVDEYKGRIYELEAEVRALKRIVEKHHAAGSNSNSNASSVHASPYKTTPSNTHINEHPEWDDERSELLSLLDRLQRQLSQAESQQHDKTAEDIKTPIASPLHNANINNNTSNRKQHETVTPAACYEFKSPPKSRHIPGSTQVPRPPPQWMSFSSGNVWSESSEEDDEEDAGVSDTNSEQNDGYDDDQEVPCATAAVNLEASFSSVDSGGENSSRQPSPRKERPGSGGANKLSPPPVVVVEKKNETRGCIIQLQRKAEAAVTGLEYSVAVECYTDALDQLGRDASIQDASSLTVELLRGRATAYLACRKFLDAAVDCCRALAIDSESIQSLDLRAEAYASMGAWELAAEDLAQLVKAPGARFRERCGYQARLDDAQRRSSAVLDCYSVLGVKPQAGSSDIKSAFRALALRVHPDKAAEVVGGREAGVLFGLLSTAHSTLSSSSKRKEHDLKLLRKKYGTSGAR